jgi:hypothetical protein
VTVTARYPCPCCGYLTLPQEPPGTYELCAVCWWEDDGVQFDDPDRRGGANTPSLNEARENFRSFGASDPDLVSEVRPPRPEERADDASGDGARIVSENAELSPERSPAPASAPSPTTPAEGSGLAPGQRAVLTLVCLTGG